VRARPCGAAGDGDGRKAASARLFYSLRRQRLPNGAGRRCGPGELAPAIRFYVWMRP